MPELPEIETIRRGLRPLEGAALCDVEVRETRLRRPVPEAALRALLGRRVAPLSRRGKYLLVPLRRGGGMILHLGMSGRLLLLPPGRPLERHDHVSWWLERDGEAIELRLRDPRRFGSVDAISTGEVGNHPLLAKMGPEPLGELFDGNYAHAASRRSRRPVKNALMDPRFVAGVGNIYACEALWRAGVHPKRAAGRISRSRWEELCGAVRDVLRDALAEGGTTLNDFRTVEGERGYFEVRLRAYGREGEGCSRCGQTIRRLVQAGRSTFYCPKCQR